MRQMVKHREMAPLGQNHICYGFFYRRVAILQQRRPMFSTRSRSGDLSGAFWRNSFILYPIESSNFAVKIFAVFSARNAYLSLVDPMSRSESKLANSIVRVVYTSTFSFSSVLRFKLVVNTRTFFYTKYELLDTHLQ